MLCTSVPQPVRKSHALFFLSPVFFFHLPIADLRRKKAPNHCKKPTVKEGLEKWETREKEMMMMMKIYLP